MKNRLIHYTLASVLGLSVNGLALAAEGEGPAPAAKTLIEMVEEGGKNNLIPLNPDDPTKDLWSSRRDFSKDKRPPGVINVQRGDFGMAYVGIPTFFKSPIALTPEDLKAGKVDVAFMGASLDMSSGRRGAAYGPAALRNSGIYVPWGKGFHTHSEHTMINPFEELMVVEHGDAPVDYTSTERSIVPVYHLVKEIAGTGTIPAIIGGDHNLMYPNVAAVSNVYGKGKVGVIHFDAHIDAEAGMIGHYLSHGQPVRRLVDEGHVPGRNYVQMSKHPTELVGIRHRIWMKPPDHHCRSSRCGRTRPLDGRCVHRCGRRNSHAGPAAGWRAVCRCGSRRKRPGPS